MAVPARIRFHMERICYRQHVQNFPLQALESVAVGSVAVTARALAESGVELTFAQWRVLVVVDEDVADPTVGEIAAGIGSATSPASRLIARMRAHGLVETVRDEHDRRVTRVRLSERGRSVRDRVVARRRELLEAAAAGVSPWPRDMELALAGLADALRAAR